MTAAPRMILVSDDFEAASKAVFGGPAPSWCWLLSKKSDFDRLPRDTAIRGLGVFLKAGGEAEDLFGTLRAWGMVTGLTAQDGKLLKDWLDKQGRAFGEPFAGIFMAMAEAAGAAQEAA
jgi:hypothetical protein